MDSLIKKARVRFFGVGQENTEELYSSEEEGRIPPPQRTRSFKTEKKRAQNWFRRQFSGNMSQDYDSDTQMEHVTAVAAAAYAIKSLEDSLIPDRKKTGGAPESFFTRLKSKKEDIPPIQATEPGRVSKRFSGEISTTASSVIPDSQVQETAAMDKKKTEKVTDPPAIKKRQSFADEHLKSPDTTKSERATDPAPSMKKTPTFSNELMHSTNGEKPPAGLVPKADMPPKEPRSADPPPPPSETRRQSSRKPGINEIRADAWEKAEMAKIKERYEKLMVTILSWEIKKKKKARSRLDKTENELERKRTRALQKFRSDMETIDQIAGGARAQAEERRRNEELKAKEKANIIRTTGKLPPTCFCF